MSIIKKPSDVKEKDLQKFIDSAPDSNHQSGKEKKVTISLHIKKSLLDKADKFADNSSISRAALINLAISEFLISKDRL